jgi:uncharacterized membrane protein YheB (UPF0754 family)
LHIPFVGAVVGWFSNWKGIKLTFYPVEFIGIKPYLGWQGIIPSQAAKMAAISVDLMTSKLIDIREIFSRIEPKRIAQEMKSELNPTTVRIVNEIMFAQFPLLWKTTPVSAKKKLYDKILETVPSAVEQMMEDTKSDIHNLLDLKKLAIDTLMQDKRLINRIFLNVGKQEFRFLIISGWFFGFFFGLLQMLIWIFYKSWWVLPVFGAIVGYTTNWIALKLIFWPVKPKKIFSFSLQGVFIKRQNAVAKEYAKIISEKILTTERLFFYIMHSADPEKFAAIINKTVNQAFDSFFGRYKSTAEFAIGKQKLEIIKNITYFRFTEEIPAAFSRTYTYSREALKIEETLYEKMSGLSEEEFIGFLRPVFQEDEVKLFILGAVLGCIAGIVQNAFIL